MRWGFPPDPQPLSGRCSAQSRGHRHCTSPTGFRPVSQLGWGRRGGRAQERGGGEADSVSLTASACVAVGPLFRPVAGSAVELVSRPSPALLRAAQPRLQLAVPGRAPGPAPQPRGREGAQRAWATGRGECGGGQGERRSRLRLRLALPPPPPSAPQPAAPPLPGPAPPPPPLPLPLRPPPLGASAAAAAAAAAGAAPAAGRDGGGAPPPPCRGAAEGCGALREEGFSAFSRPQCWWRWCAAPRGRVAGGLTGSGPGGGQGARVCAPGAGG